MPLRRLAFVAVACSSLACSSTERAPWIEPPPPIGGPDLPFPDGGPYAHDLVIDPPNAVLLLDTATSPATPAKQVYTVTSGGKAVAAPEMVIRDRRLGAFTGATFKTAMELPKGSTSVTEVIAARADGKLGYGQVSIVAIKKGGAFPDVPFTFPLGGGTDPARAVVKFGASIGQIDLAVVMDTTGSMSGSISNLKANLVSKLFPALVSTVPFAGIAIVDHRDFPVSPYGDIADWPVVVRQRITTNVLEADAQLGKMVAGGGADGPEGQLPAMLHTLTGVPIEWASGSVPVHSPPPGRSGGVDFRTGSLPVVVLITDISWHAPDGAAYGTEVITKPSIAEVAKAFTDAHARFVDMTVEGQEKQAVTLSDLTQSNVPVGAFAGECGVGKCCTGVSGAARTPDGPGGSCRLNFLHSAGTGVSDDIITALKGIALGTVFDVSAVLSNDPANPDGFDATKLVKSMRALHEGDKALGCEAHEALDTDADGVKDTFTAVVTGTPVCFEIIPVDKGTIAPTSKVQVYSATFTLMGAPGAVVLDKRSLSFIVAPTPLP